MLLRRIKRVGIDPTFQPFEFTAIAFEANSHVQFRKNYTLAIFYAGSHICTYVADGCSKGKALRQTGLKSISNISPGPLRILLPRAFLLRPSVLLSAVFVRARLYTNIQRNVHVCVWKCVHTCVLKSWRGSIDRLRSRTLFANRALYGPPIGLVRFHPRHCAFIRAAKRRLSFTKYS